MVNDILQNSKQLHKHKYIIHLTTFYILKNI